MCDESETCGDIGGGGGGGVGGGGGIQQYNAFFLSCTHNHLDGQWAFGVEAVECESGLLDLMAGIEDIGPADTRQANTRS